MALGRAACGERHLGAAAILAALSALMVAGATYGPPWAGNVGREGGGVSGLRGVNGSGAPRTERVAPI